MGLLLFAIALLPSALAAPPTLLFVAQPTNDVFTAAAKGPLPTKHFPTVSAALAAATPNDGLLVMAEGMLPSNPGVPQVRFLSIFLVGFLVLFCSFSLAVWNRTAPAPASPQAIYPCNLLVKSGPI